jgi:hypothetical protein
VSGRRPVATKISSTRSVSQIQLRVRSDLDPLPSQDIPEYRSRFWLLRWKKLGQHFDHYDFGTEPAVDLRELEPYGATAYHRDAGRKRFLVKRVHVRQVSRVGEPTNGWHRGSTRIWSLATNRASPKITSTPIFRNRSGSSCSATRALAVRIRSMTVSKT